MLLLTLLYLRQFCEAPTWHRTAYPRAKLVLGSPSGNAKPQLGKVIGEGIVSNNVRDSAWKCPFRCYPIKNTPSKGQIGAWRSFWERQAPAWRSDCSWFCG